MQDGEGNIFCICLYFALGILKFALNAVFNDQRN